MQEHHEPKTPPLAPVTLPNVKIKSGFWGSRQKTNDSKTIPAVYHQRQIAGRLDWQPGQPHKPHIFWDSDAGHLIEGAVAYWQATGKRKLLDVMIRYADYIDQAFGPNEGQVPGYCGHPEVELAMVMIQRSILCPCREGLPIRHPNRSRVPVG